MSNNNTPEADIEHILSIRLHEYPHDVQEMLKERALKNCTTIAHEVKAFSLQTARLINQSKTAA